MTALNMVYGVRFAVRLHTMIRWHHSSKRPAHVQQAPAPGAGGGGLDDELARTMQQPGAGLSVPGLGSH